MNTIKLNKLLLLFFIAILFGCNKNDNPLSENAKEGGLIEVQTGTVVYFLNTMEDNYPIDLKYFQGVGTNIASIDVYKQFYTVDDTGAVVSSEKTLYKTLDLSSFTEPGFISYNATFKSLAEGTTINGQLIPQDDTLLTAGFYWELTYDIILEDGRHVQVNANTVFINSRYAGKYRVLDALYYRIGVLTYGIDEWPTEVTVTALNATTFKMEAPCEPFASNSVYFTIDEASGAITVLKSYGGSTLYINSQAMQNCASDPGTFNNVPCDNSNILIKVPSTKDTLRISYGYFTAGSGPREFYQEMVKI